MQMKYAEKEGYLIFTEETRFRCRKFAVLNKVAANQLQIKTNRATTAVFTSNLLSICQLSHKYSLKVYT